MKNDFFKTTQGLVLSIVLAVAIGFFLGMEYKASQIRDALYDVSSGLDYTTEEPETVLIEKKIGDEVEFATIKVKVNGVEEKQILSAKYSDPTPASKDAKFVVIDVDITNVTTDPFTFWSDGIFVKDDQGRRFNPYGSAISDIDDHIDARDLAPSITESGYMVYEIPQDAEHYSLNILKGGTDEEYAIVLK